MARLSWYKIPPTRFGDSNLGQVDYANGSELDAAYVYVDMVNSILYLMLTGNLESNFNKLEIFFDTGAGGRTACAGTALPSTSAG
jgi:hypothetical protein